MLKEKKDSLPVDVRRSKKNVGTRAVVEASHPYC